MVYIWFAAKRILSPIYIKNHKIISFLDRLVISYPAASSLSLFWNLGRFLGIILISQIVRGIFLVFYFVPSINEAFFRVDYIRREVFFGFVLRILHLNGASTFFFIIFLHVGRGLFFRSFFLENTWLSGTSILILVMATAFLGYVLPWGQISFWGATVITNLISTIPFCGTQIVLWLWGGFNVGGATLCFFFSLHYLLPFVTLALVFLHLIFLHETRRTSSLRTRDMFFRVSFSPFFTRKDFINILFLGILFFFWLNFPWILGDSENWITANALSSPVHIQPEWYFLFAYAILRCIPRKLGGVMALVLRVAVFYFFPFFCRKNININFLYLFVLSIFFISFLILTWLGRCPVEEPFIFLRQFFRLLYFVPIFFLIFL